MGACGCKSAVRDVVERPAKKSLKVVVNNLEELQRADKWWKFWAAALEQGFDLTAWEVASQVITCVGGSTFRMAHGHVSYMRVTDLQFPVEWELTLQPKPRCQKTRLLLVSDHLEEHEVLLNAVKAEVVAVPVMYATWSLQDLMARMRSLAGEPAHQFDSLGILDHGSPGSFCLLKSAAGGSIELHEVKEMPELQEFLLFIAGYVKPPKVRSEWREDKEARIDLMGCCIAAGEEGMELLTYLEDLTKVNWAASTNETGAGDAVANGFDWFMESDCIDVHTCYFHEQALREWQHHASLLGCLEYLDYVPVVGQCKGFVHLACNDEAGARNALERSVGVTSYVPILGHAQAVGRCIAGDAEGAKGDLVKSSGTAAAVVVGVATAPAIAAAGSAMAAGAGVTAAGVGLSSATAAALGGAGTVAAAGAVGTIAKKEVEVGLELLTQKEVKENLNRLQKDPVGEGIDVVSNAVACGTVAICAPVGAAAGAAACAQRACAAGLATVAKTEAEVILEVATAKEDKKATKRLVDNPGSLLTDAAVAVVVGGTVDKASGMAMTAAEKGTLTHAAQDVAKKTAKSAMKRTVDTAVKG